jgi:hypothetical protein
MRGLFTQQIDDFRKSSAERSRLVGPALEISKSAILARATPKGAPQTPLTVEVLFSDDRKTPALRLHSASAEA